MVNVHHKVWKELKPEDFKGFAEEYISALRANNVVLKGGMLDIIRNIPLDQDKSSVRILLVRASDIVGTSDVCRTTTYGEVCSIGQSLGLKLLPLQALLAVMCMEPDYYQEISGEIIAAASAVQCRLSGYGGRTDAYTVEATLPYFKSDRLRLCSRFAESNRHFSGSKVFAFAEV